MPHEAVIARKAHVAIRVTNVAASIEFYKKLFGRWIIAPYRANFFYVEPI